MTDEQIEWPREIWMAEREEHDQGVVRAVLSEHATIARWEGDTERDREFHRYVDADIHESAERYYQEMLSKERGANVMLAAALQNLVNGIETGLITSDADETLANALRQARSALSPPSEPQGGRVMTLAERLEKIKGRVLDDATCDLVLIDDAVKEAEIVLLCHGTLRAGQASAHVHDFICNAPTEAATEFLEHHGVDPNGPHTGYLPLSVNPKGGE